MGGNHWRRVAFCLLAICSNGVLGQHSSTMSGSGSSSGSGSGQGFILDPCMDACQAGPGLMMCREVGGEAECVCNVGYMLVDGYRCEGCPPDKYGEECTQDCYCNVEKGNRCDPVDGSCTCTSCFFGSDCDLQLDDGVSCIEEYLKLDNYGKMTYLGTFSSPPQVEEGLTKQVAIDLLDISDSGAIEEAVVQVIDREELGATPLLKVTFTVNKQVLGESVTSNALDELANKVKVGTYRTTLITENDPSESTAEVTLNV